MTKRTIMPASNTAMKNNDTFIFEPRTKTSAGMNGTNKRKAMTGTAKMCDGSSNRKESHLRKFTPDSTKLEIKSHATSHSMKVPMTAHTSAPKLRMLLINR